MFDEYWKLRMEGAATRLAAARKLIRHNPTRGSAAENVLRALLRDFLPLRCGLGSGFLLDAQGKSSRQLDVIVFDQFDSAPLYRDGDLVIVSPDSAHLVIEVKSNLNRKALDEAFENIASAKGLNANLRGVIFGYESATEKTLTDVLSGAKAAYGAACPDQIFCSERSIFVIWQAGSYRGYELDTGKQTQQLINEVLSAGKVKNLLPYLPSLTLGASLFTV